MRTTCWIYKEMPEGIMVEQTLEAESVANGLRVAERALMALNKERKPRLTGFFIVNLKNGEPLFVKIKLPKELYDKTSKGKRYGKK